MKKLLPVMLALTVWAGAQPVPRAFYGAVGEPRETVLAGGGQDPAGFADMVATLGAARVPAFFMTYLGIAGEVEDARAWGEELARDLAVYPAGVGVQLGLSFTTDGVGEEAQYGEAVAAGEHDARLDAIGEALAALDRPVYVRIGYEFIGGWNGYRPESYRAAFRRITERLRARCARVATVWCAIPIRTLAEQMEFYPGDDVVDWWGIDVFEPVMFSRPVAHDLMRAAEAHRKPMMIGEATPARIGADRGRVSWEGWYRLYFDFIDQWPGIKATSYINWQWSATRWGWLDARVSQLEGWTREQVLGRMSGPLYDYAAGPAPTDVRRVVGRVVEGETRLQDETRVKREWHPQRPGNWEGRAGAGAGLDLVEDAVTWLDFEWGEDVGEVVRAELWLAVWPEEDGEGVVAVVREAADEAELEVVATFARRDGGYVAMLRAEVTTPVDAARAAGGRGVRLGLRSGSAAPVAVDGPNDPDPFEPQIFLFTAREDG